MRSFNRNQGTSIRAEIWGYRKQQQILNHCSRVKSEGFAKLPAEQEDELLEEAEWRRQRDLATIPENAKWWQHNQNEWAVPFINIVQRVNIHHVTPKKLCLPFSEHNNPIH